MFFKKLDYLRKVLRSGLCAYLSLQMNFAMRKIVCPQHSHIIKHITNVLYFIPGICFHYVLLHYHILISIINTVVPKLHSSTRMFRFQIHLSSTSGFNTQLKIQRQWGFSIASDVKSTKADDNVEK